MYLRGQSQPEEEETRKEWKALGPIHFHMLPIIGLQEILWGLGDEDHTAPAHKSSPIHRERCYCKSAQGNAIAEK